MDIKSASFLLLETTYKEMGLPGPLSGIRAPIFVIIFTVMISSANALAASYACNSGGNDYAFCNSSKSIEERVRDLVSRLSLEEKVSQLSNNASGIDRLGIPKYEWWSEALHGVAKSGYGIRFGEALTSATSFPQVILSAASFNASLWYLIGQATGREARAFFNAGQAKGLTFWAPNINIFRDPRWGRGQETPGEDPLLTSRYSVAFVRGLQGDTANDRLKDIGSSAHLKASACCKHFTAYDLDNWMGHTRYSFDALVSKQDLLDTYQPPFKSCVEEGRASGIMCSYNSVNGVPTCADYNLLTETARNAWGFQGYIVSDCDAVSIIHTAHNYAPSAEDAVADVLKAGMDVNCGDYLPKHSVSAIRQGKLQESEVDKALHHLFSVQMRLGLFDKVASEKLYGRLGKDAVCSPQHQELALDAARQGITLVKNDMPHLPLSKKTIKSLAVIGPNANNATSMLGNYYGIPCRTVTPLEGLQRYVPNTFYAAGCKDVACESDNMIAEAIEISKKVDQVILVIGLDQTQEKEEKDRVNLNLPGEQEKLVQQVSLSARKPVTLVIVSGGPVDVSFAVNHPKIGSIIWAGYPGQAGGQALAEIIFGDYNPSGRLPMTWYPQDFTKIAMTDMRMRANSRSDYPGRTYRFYSGPKVFEFGHGLSYSHYSYKFSPKTVSRVKVNTVKSSDVGVKLEDVSCKEIEFRCHIHVRNEGKLEGRHSVLLFSSSPATHSGAPLKQLIGFKNLYLKAGEKANVVFLVKPCEHLSSVQENGESVLAFGSHSLVVGDAKFSVSLL